MTLFVAETDASSQLPEASLGIFRCCGGRPSSARESILCLKRRAETLLNPPPKKSLVSQVIIQNMGSRVSSQPASDQSDQSPSKEGVARSRKRKLPTEAPANDMPTVPETSSIERRRKRRK